MIRHKKACRSALVVQACSWSFPPERPSSDGARGDLFRHWRKELVPAPWTRRRRSPVNHRGACRSPHSGQAGCQNVVTVCTILAAALRCAFREVPGLVVVGSGGGQSWVGGDDRGQLGTKGAAMHKRLDGPRRRPANIDTLPRVTLSLPEALRGLAVLSRARGRRRSAARRGPGGRPRIAAAYAAFRRVRR